MAARWRSIVALPEGGRLAHHNMRIYAAKDCCDFRLWLDSEVQSPEIDFRFTPESRHSEAHAGLPVMTHSGHRELMDLPPSTQ